MVPSSPLLNAGSFSQPVIANSNRNFEVIDDIIDKPRRGRPPKNSNTGFVSAVVFPSSSGTMAANLTTNKKRKFQPNVTSPTQI